MSTPGRPPYHLDLGNLPPIAPSNQNRSESSTAASSPVEQPSNATSRLPSLEGANPLSALNGPTGTRRNAGSPSNEHGSRFYPRRARELLAEGSSRHMWGPPTASGLSTPLRETIPESPGDDTFPDLGTTGIDSILQHQGSSSAPRSRAGTVPSQFPPVSLQAAAGQQSIPIKTSQDPTPSTSPFRPLTASSIGIRRSNSGASAIGKSSLLSRMRAGSMPQRPSLLSSTQSPFGSSVFSSSWNAGRDRASTHSGAQSGDTVSPPMSAFPKDLSDAGIKTLDYLGLADPPLSASMMADLNRDSYAANTQRGSTIPQPLLANLAALNRNNRFRSYSVNAKEKYAAEEDEEGNYGMYYSGNLTPSAEAAAAAVAATHAQIYQHNLDVQAFANQASASRPRARTAGVLDAPSSRIWRPSASRFDGISSNQYQDLNDAVRAMELQTNSNTGDYEGETVGEATRALWLGGIPASTTPSSLKVIFESYGKIDSARVLTHKSCGFVNFVDIESAIRAKLQLNGKEIFPGAGAVRIGYAKAPSSTGTPAANGVYQSPSPDPYNDQSGNLLLGSTHRRESFGQGLSVFVSSLDMKVPALHEIRSEMLQIVIELGATEDDLVNISATIDHAIRFDHYESEIPPIPEANHNRVFDAPRLRDIRKRIDNNSCTQAEVEETAMSMLPEIADLASDYLGNTVVQKLFEFCSEQTKEAMLQEIAPRIAEVGVHKNGTWAAQKIIDTARTPSQMNAIVDNMRPYAMACFLDQYGNYVMQCCLRFSHPWNNFIFEAMLCRLLPISIGRFGARAMRACLESHHATKEQQRMLAAAIAIHGVRLASDANGALLLTWFLDTCTFPHRRKVLAPRLVPHLVHLCTHKVAYLTVLKVINQRNEPEARDIILHALFLSADSRVLEEILKDQSSGATFVFKVLTTPSLDENIRGAAVESIRKVLAKLKAQPAQGYRRLMDEVGLSTKGPVAAGRDSSLTRDAVEEGRRGSGHSNGSFSHGSAAFIPTLPGQNAKSYVAMDGPMGFEAFTPGTGAGINPQTHPIGASIPQTPSQAQTLYQQAASAPGRQAAYNMSGVSGNGYASPNVGGIGSMPRHGMPAQGFPMGTNPMMGQQGYVPSNYGPMTTANNNAQRMWQQQYPNAYMMPQQQQQQGQHQSPGRRY